MTTEGFSPDWLRAAVLKAMNTVSSETVARRLVLRKPIWDLCVAISEDMKSRGVQKEPMDVAVVALECGMAQAAMLIEAQAGTNCPEADCARCGRRLVKAKSEFLSKHPSDPTTWTWVCFPSCKAHQALATQAPVTLEEQRAAAMGGF